MSGPQKARRTQHFPDPRLEHQIDELVRAINAAVDALAQIGVDIDLRISQHAADTSLHITRDYRDAMDKSLVHPSATNPFVTEESLNDAMTGSAKPGVQTLEDLAAIPPDQRADKDTRLVEDEGKIYRFDADADHGDVKPLEGPGWWIAVAAATPNHNNLSNLQGGSATERYHLTKAERDSLVAHLADTNNPHQVTPEQIGAETPAGAQAKVDAHASRTDNPHRVTAAQVGAYPAGSKVADSERLNGQPASYYTDIPARLGYTPVNKSGDDMTGELTIWGAKLQRVKVVDFWVDGNADTYYPVVIRGVSHYNYPQRWLQIWRYYSWEAPDTWNTATHRGGLDLKIAFRLTGWGGQEYYLEITHLRTYSYMVADITVASPDTNTLIVWLRGGHARYQFISEDPNLEPEVYIGDYIHMPGTQNERTYSPRTTVEPMWQKNVRILTTLSEVYAGGGYRSPKDAYKVWHAGNDGSGSGLDADLLDGQHGSYYASKSYVDGLLGAPMRAGTNFVVQVTRPGAEISFYGDTYPNWEQSTRNASDGSNNVAVCIFLPGTVRCALEHRSAQSGQRSYVRVLKNGSVVQEWNTNSKSLVSRSVDVNVSPGDVITFQQRLSNLTASSMSYWRNLRVMTAAPTLGIQRVLYPN